MMFLSICSLSEPGVPVELRSELSIAPSTIKAPGVQAGVYIKVDSLGPGQCFVSTQECFSATSADNITL